MGTKINVGLLLVTLLSTGLYVVFLNPEGASDVAFRIDRDKSTFYVKNDLNRFIVAGREYNSLWDGTSKMNRRLSSFTNKTIFNYETGQLTHTRRIDYIRGPYIIDTWIFDWDATDIELFPYKHIIEIYNAEGFIYQYEVRDLTYDGPTVKFPLDIYEYIFGLNMKVQWDEGFYWAKRYMSGIFKVRWRVKTDYLRLENRLYDPLPIEQIPIVETPQGWVIGGKPLNFIDASHNCTRPEIDLIECDSQFDGNGDGWCNPKLGEGCIKFDVTQNGYQFRESRYDYGKIPKIK